MAATDASSTGGGMAYAEAAPDVMQRWREEQLWSDEAGNALQELPWKVAHAYRWAWSEHINLLEASALCSWARWAGTTRNAAGRHLVLVILFSGSGATSLRAVSRVALRSAAPQALRHASTH
eukprot:TRINITY_DN1594_c0_g1_i1.p3 TRINITY_DN1594_c0_g1~~TRINITY_DN1594_c0_g1_i1.p3  ORF type:complete len:122 (+),score=24.86 TRINITY_DN1594_c0_g1_i1:521-886(+)